MHKKTIMSGLKIGSVTIAGKFVAAPMAGVTDLPFRLMLRELHKGLSSAEMISSQSLTRCKSKKLYQNQISDADQPTSYQLLGRNPSYMADSAKLMRDMGARIIDINMGCSVRKVIKQKEGAALIAEPELALQIIEAVVKAVDLPVMLKIRKSYKEYSGAQIIKNAQNSGIAAIAVHGRSQEQLYSGLADWDFVTEMKAISSIPVIGNGDIKTPQEAVNRLRASACDGVMIGRAMLGNPWIFKAAGCLYENKPYSPPTQSERLETARKHMELSSAIEGEPTCYKKIRKHLSWYIKGMPMASILRDKIFHTPNTKAIKELWQRYTGFVCETESMGQIPIGSLENIFLKYISIR